MYKSKTLRIVFLIALVALPNISWSQTTTPLPTYTPPFESSTPTPSYTPYVWPTPEFSPTPTLAPATAICRCLCKKAAMYLCPKPKMGNVCVESNSYDIPQAAGADASSCNKYSDPANGKCEGYGTQVFKEEGQLTNCTFIVTPS